MALHLGQVYKVKKVLKIDNNGFFVEDVILKDSEEILVDYIQTECPDGFYKPKWNGTEWVEGLTQEEIEEFKNKPRELSEIEQLKIIQAEQFESILELIGGM